MSRYPRFAIAVLTAFALLTAVSPAQEVYAPAQSSASSSYTPPNELQNPQPDSAPTNVSPLPAGRIGQLVAPIALYPDPLLAQILMASTYPLEVVEAARWQKDPAHASLTGEQLTDAMAEQSWDPSVKALVSVPQVLQMLDANIPWTEALGNAFIAQQAAVMDAVQQLRQKAAAAGNLVSTPQQTVQDESGAITIKPASPDTVYVPYYNPMQTYGEWPYPGYDPYYFPPPYGYYYDEGLLGFGFGFSLFGPFWGRDHWDWNHHHIDVDNRQYSGIGRQPGGPGVWRHDPAHRLGVPYPGQSRSRFTSYTPRLQPFAARSLSASQPSSRPLASELVHTYSTSSGMRSGTPNFTPQHSAAPMFESYAPRMAVESYASRGMESRSAMPAMGGGSHFSAGGGGHGGGDNRR